MKRLSILFALSTFMLFSLAAQTGTIRGRIVDENNLALPGASVYTSDMEYGTITDVYGNYIMSNVPAGEYQLKVAYIGFTDAELNVTVTAGKTTVTNINMKPGIGIKEVTVTSALQGQSKALNLQKTNENITNIIASDQIGKFPDANIGDALKRIPGVNVQYDQGEARFGNIRGVAPQYNSVTINGERIPSAEAENRTIQLDLIPSDMIQMIEVNKAVTPDMDADAVGASVNLTTISNPYKQRISGSIGSGYNFLANKPVYSGNLIYGNRFAKNHIGMILSASYHNNNLGSDNVEAEWDGDEDNYYANEVQVRQYYLQRIRQSYSAAFDFKINENHTLFLKGIYNKRGDWENRYRTVYKPEGEPEGGIFAGETSDGDESKVERETKAGDNKKNGRLEDQQMMQFSLSGQHLFGKVIADWGASYSKASEDRPKERYLQFEIEGEDIYYDGSDTKKPFMTLNNNVQDLNENWSLSELTEENQYTEDIDVTTKINIEIPIVEGKFKNAVKFGGKYRSKSKERENNFFEFSPTDEDAFVTQALNNTANMSKDDFMPGDKYDVGSFASKGFVGGLNLDDATSFEKEADYSEYAGNFEAEEKVAAAYVMLSQNLGKKLSAIVGVRMEHTASENVGRSWDDDEEILSKTEKQSNNYTNILPDLHLKYNLAANSILRFAFTNTIARPNYYDLVPYQEIEDGEEISIGNPDLDPTTSSNIDVMAEHYFQSIGLLSGGFFYKDIKDFIVSERHSDYDYNGTTWDNFNRPINGGNATLWGIEVAGQRQLDFLPGFLKGFGVYANYTYTNSQITDFNIEGREDETLNMPGSPEHTVNLSLSYESKKFSTRLSFNYASDFIDEFGEEAFFDRYYDKVTYLDLNLTYAINKHFLTFVDFNNLLNQPLRYYQGKSDRTMQAEYYGMSMRFGAKVNF